MVVFCGFPSGSGSSVNEHTLVVSEGKAPCLGRTGRAFVAKTYNLRVQGRPSFNLFYNSQVYFRLSSWQQAPKINLWSLFLLWKIISRVSFHVKVCGICNVGFAMWILKWHLKAIFSGGTQCYLKKRLDSVVLLTCFVVESPGKGLLLVPSYLSPDSEKWCRNSWLNEDEMKELQWDMTWTDIARGHCFLWNEWWDDSLII